MTHGHRFEASGDWLERLDGRERRRAIPPEKIVNHLGLRRTDEVADLGAGIGFFAFPMAARAKRVLCVDIERKMLDVLSQRMRRRKVGNMLPLLGNIQEPPIVDSSVDHVLGAFVFHEVDDPRIFLYECNRIMRPAGTLTIVDFQKHAPIEFGPPEEIRKTPEQVARACATQFAERSRFEDEVYYQISFSKKGCAAR
jgi:ubiquinone/menaquinone biosynthesis C-methylase UbiE